MPAPPSPSHPLSASCNSERMYSCGAYVRTPMPPPQPLPQQLAGQVQVPPQAMLAAARLKASSPLSCLLIMGCWGATILSCLSGVGKVPTGQQQGRAGVGQVSERDEGLGTWGLEGTHVRATHPHYTPILRCGRCVALTSDLRALHKFTVKPYYSRFIVGRIRASTCTVPAAF